MKRILLRQGGEFASVRQTGEWANGRIGASPVSPFRPISRLNTLLLVSGLSFTLSIAWTCRAAAAPSLTFAEVPVSPGSTVKANVPLSAQEKSLAAQGGNAAPPSAVAVFATPVNFNPQKSWPVLVICSTSDSKRQNRDDLADFYRRVGL